MTICLCEVCFPAALAANVEVLTIVPMSPCEACGRTSKGYGGNDDGPRLNLFPSDPRPEHRRRMMSPEFQPCCEAWRHAHDDGTDSEGAYSLIWYDDDHGPGPHVGTYDDHPPVKFCPWCGAHKPGCSSRGRQG
jgi:hypothetical protein